MTLPDPDDLEEPLRRLRGAVQVLIRMADGRGNNSTDTDALNFLADHMAADVRAVQEWYEAAHEAAKGSVPRAVS